MELRFTIVRTLILVVLVALFYFLGGFINPNSLVADGGYAISTRAWFYTMVMYLVGAFCVSVVEHETGTMDPISLRPLYIIGGLALMAGGYFWGNFLRDTAANQSAMWLLELSSSFC